MWTPLLTPTLCAHGSAAGAAGAVGVGPHLPAIGPRADALGADAVQVGTHVAQVASCAVEPRVDGASK